LEKLKREKEALEAEKKDLQYQLEEVAPRWRLRLKGWLNVRIGPINGG